MSTDKASCTGGQRRILLDPAGLSVVQGMMSSSYQHGFHLKSGLEGIYRGLVGVADRCHRMPPELAIRGVIADHIVP